MIAESTLVGLALLYAGLLFLVAWFAERSPSLNAHLHPLIYALSLSVYCSSWSFYGAVGSAANHPWQHAAIYIGPILLYLFAWPAIKRMIAIGSRQRVTSIADFIGSRYGKRQSLAALVTVVATAAVLPYIALQLKALAQSWSIVTGHGELSPGSTSSTDSAFFTAAIMAVFTILFGTRRLDSQERHRGLMTAIAAESLVKLMAFCAVAGLAVAYLTSALPSEQLGQILVPWGHLTITPDFCAQVVLSMLAIVCLPRQFHVSVVEYQNERDGAWGRWLLPLYLLIFMLLAVPVSMAGAQLFAGAPLNPDTFVLQLPIALDQKLITIAAYIGGISAATGMAIVATVSLTIMITNELVVPMLIRLNPNPLKSLARLGDRLRHIRQFSIATVFFLAWCTGNQLENVQQLSDIGFLSFLAAAQLAPALLAGIYWRRGNALGVLVGMTAGLLIWLYCALLPSLLPPDHELLREGLFQQTWLRPTELFGIAIGYQLAHATLWSLLINSSLLVIVSLLTRTSTSEQHQMVVFLSGNPVQHHAQDLDYSPSPMRVSQLQALLTTILQHDAAPQWREFEAINQQRLLPGDRAPQFVVDRIESLLAAHIGTASANRTIKRLTVSHQLGLQDIAGIISGANRQNQINRELLQTTMDSVSQGISVVDSSLKLVAWNTRYEKMFNYPERLLYIGCPIERILRFNAERGLIAVKSNLDEEIRQRLAAFCSGGPYRLERTLPNGIVVDIRGNPMPQGGFVTTYLDITEYKNTLDELEEARQALEQRVATGSQVLTETNAKLRRENQLRARAEASLREAHGMKSRFMSATSHDLLQPINAARLFTATLKARHQQQRSDPALMPIIDGIDHSLTNAEALITALREIARLDSGKQKPQTIHFNARPFIEQLAIEFQMMASTQGLQLRSHASSRWLYSDPHLLRRILQNFLANAIRYTSTGRVILGCRQRPQGLSIEVWDTGPGIPEGEQLRIFSEFERLQQPGLGNDEGLGLGLAIAKRCADMLNHPIHLRSRPGHGTVFSVLIPYGEAKFAPPEELKPTLDPDLHGTKVLCIDNDSNILRGMNQLLETWDCEVATARGSQSAREQFEADTPTIVLADYHLTANEVGVDIALQLNRDRQKTVPVIIISADDSEATRNHIKAAGYHFMAKPINPGRLKAAMRQLIKPPAE
jgi:Na+/proline symporter/signal transduction histidine kinase